MKKLRFCLILTIVLLNLKEVYGCSCALQTPQAHFDQADVVFIGKVLEVDAAWGQQEVELEVLEISKLDDEDDAEEEKFTVYTALNEAECGYNFEKSGVYQVFANREDGRLITDLCSGNQRFRSYEN